MFIHLIVAPVGMWFYKDPFYGHMKLAVPFLKTLFRLTGIRLTVHGLENIPTDQHFLIVSNHQSLLDIFVYMIIIPRRISFIFKKELMKVPILNVSLLLQGHAILDRQNPRKAISQLKKVENLLEKQRSFVIFPEGTRSSDGCIQSFKSGGFGLAVQTGTAILPCYLKGTGEIISKYKKRFRGGDISLTILPAISVEKKSKKRDKKNISNEYRDKVYGVLKAAEANIEQ